MCSCQIGNLTFFTEHTSLLADHIVKPLHCLNMKETVYVRFKNQSNLLKEANFKNILRSTGCMVSNMQGTVETKL